MQVTLLDLHLPWLLGKHNNPLPYPIIRLILSEVKIHLHCQNDICKNACNIVGFAFTLAPWEAQQPLPCPILGSELS
jgi:hypothetical protein